MTKGNPTIQIRLHPDVIAKVEKRASAMGFIKPAGEPNLSEYVRSLIMRDINSSTEILIDEPEKYSVK